MRSNDPAYQIRVANAAKQLSDSRRTQYRGAPRTGRAAPRRLSGVGCNCSVQRVGSYKVVRAVKQGLAGIGATDNVVAMIPISDPRAVQNAIRLFQRAKGLPVSGLGAAEQAQGAASMAAAGAKVGSIVPGIGTVIGAVVGAVAGWIMGKSKPVRPSAAERAQCKAMLTEYNSIAAQSPNAPIPMEWSQLLDLNWCVQATYGPDIGLRDPRWFNPGFQDGLRPMALDIVKKIYETPVGATVNLEAFTFKDPKGRTLSFKGFSFVNPVFTDLKSFTDQYWIKAGISFCENTAGKGAKGCVTEYSHPEFRRLMYDLLAWAARTTLPNISENDLRAASQVASTVGGSAKDVVTAVESIIKRNVARDETAALLSPTANAPPIIPPSAIAPLIPPPTVPPTQAVPLPGFPNLPSVNDGPSTVINTPEPNNALPAAVTAGVNTINPWMAAIAAAFAFAILKPKKSRKK